MHVNDERKNVWRRNERIHSWFETLHAAAGERAAHILTYSCVHSSCCGFTKQSAVLSAWKRLDAINEILIQALESIDTFSPAKPIRCLHVVSYKVDSGKTKVCSPPCDRSSN